MIPAVLGAEHSNNAGQGFRKRRLCGKSMTLRRSQTNLQGHIGAVNMEADESFLEFDTATQHQRQS